MSEYLTKGVYQVGVLVSDIDECLKLFRDLLGMKVVFEARNQLQTAKGLSGVDNQIMNVLMLHGEGGAPREDDLLFWQVPPLPKPPPPFFSVRTVRFFDI